MLLNVPKAFLHTTCYHGLMERAVDKAIVLLCCLLGLALVPWEPILLVALLLAVAQSALSEALSQRYSSIPAILFSIASLISLPFALFLPLSVYDMARDTRVMVRACWILPALGAALRLPLAPTAVIVIACGVAYLLSFRARKADSEQIAYRRARDNVREASLALEGKNRGLREKQDLEVRLATLAERGRIARDIHDNVGHLITRSIMQVEALQVVHRDNVPVCDEFAQVGTTLHEAMDTVRASVHDLHDDAFDLETQIGEVAAGVTLSVDVDYRATELPVEVGYCFIAVIREALSNSSRHGNADRASVSVVDYPGFYRLTVHDNGSVAPSDSALDGLNGGFAAQRRNASRGIGLSTMADRVRVLDGMFRVGYDRGFKVFVTVPKGEDQP